MRHDKWFKSIKVNDRGKLLRTSTKRERDGVPSPKLRGARLIDVDAWRYPSVGVQVDIAGSLETFYTTRDIIKICDIDKSTVYKWQKTGLIPEPMFTRSNNYGKETKYYVRDQIVVIAKVVNDLRRQGVIRMSSKKIRHHVDMIATGDAAVKREWKTKKEKLELAEQTRRNRVIWIKKG